nr:MAG TPA: Receptor activity modifying family [Caudoviricetes sp.]
MTQTILTLLIVLLGAPILLILLMVNLALMIGVIKALVGGKKTPKEKGHNVEP